MQAKKPTECKSKDEIREQIDITDREIIRLFSERNKYVEEIVKYKYDEESIIAQERKDEVIRTRGQWAEDMGINKAVIESIYRTLIENNINRELDIFHNNDLIEK